MTDMMFIFFVVVIIILVVIWLIWNESRYKNWIQTYGTITKEFPSGLYYKGVRQVEIMLKYEIDGTAYEGCATLMTNRYYCYPLGMVVPIRVNPKNLIDCSIIQR